MMDHIQQIHEKYNQELSLIEQRLQQQLLPILDVYDKNVEAILVAKIGPEERKRQKCLAWNELLQRSQEHVQQWEQTQKMIFEQRNAEIELFLKEYHA